MEKNYHIQRKLYHITLAILPLAILTQTTSRVSTVLDLQILAKFNNPEGFPLFCVIHFSCIGSAKSMEIHPSNLTAQGCEEATVDPIPAWQGTYTSLLCGYTVHVWQQEIKTNQTPLSPVKPKENED